MNVVAVYANSTDEFGHHALRALSNGATPSLASFSQRLLFVATVQKLITWAKVLELAGEIQMAAMYVREAAWLQEVMNRGGKI